MKDHSKLFPLNLGKITSSGFLREQQIRNKKGMGGSIPDIEPEMIAKPYVDHNHKSHFFAGYTAEISATYWYGLAELAFTLNDKTLIKRIKDWVYGAIALQEKDGFLGSYRKGRKDENRMEDYCAWGSNWAYRAMLSYYDATGDKKVLNAVHKALLWFVKHWAGDKKGAYAGNVISDSMITVAHLTGDGKLVQFSRDYMDWLNRDGHDIHHHGANSMLRSRFNYRDDHAVAFGEHVKHPALLYTVSGDEKDLAASRSGFRQMFEQGWQVTDAPASCSEHLAPPSCIHDTEYCNFSTWFDSFVWMGRITGEAEWFDRAEKILFNGGMGARLKNEKGIAYMSAPNQISAGSESGGYNMIETTGARRVFTANYTIDCCPNQSLRIVPAFIRNAFQRTEKGDLCAALYGPVTASPEKGMRITEETEYPFEETVRFHIKCETEKKMSLKLRKPLWCRAFEVRRNGKKADYTLEDNWITLAGPWKDDVVELVLSMEIEIRKIKDAYFPVEPLRACYYGPLLFAHAFPGKITELTVPQEIGKLTWWAAINVSRCSEKYPWYEVRVPPKEREWYALPSNVSASDCRIVRKKAGSYAWEESPVRLLVPMVRATKNWNHSSTEMTMPFGNPVYPDDGAPVEMLELVPYGCTLLRQSCFPITKD